MRLIETVRELAAKHPDNVYKPGRLSQGCFYSTGECTNKSYGCIFGQALRSLGYDVEALDEELNSRGDGDEETSINVACDVLGIDLGDYYHWARNVQSWQDNGHNWATAVAKADKDREGV